MNQADEELVANIYDAAGHRAYRASHGLFMSTAALFLHVVRADMSEDQAAAAVLEWVDAVQQQAPGSVMGVVWTCFRVMMPEFGCSRPCWRVSGKSPNGRCSR